MISLLGANTVINPIAGGIMIGIASAGLMFFNGRIAGISGIVKGFLRFEKGDFLWRAAFILGMILTGYLFQLIYPDFFLFEISRSLWAYGFAGLLIGLGTGLAKGCTSGHGVCGVARLSNRSVTITMSFTASGIIVVWIINTFLGGSI